MAKAYWIAFYNSIKNPDALAAYAKLAGPAIQAGGGKFLARGGTAKTYEPGLKQRVVVIEFESVDKAIADARRRGLSGSVEGAGQGRRRAGHADSRRGRVNENPAGSRAPPLLKQEG